MIARWRWELENHTLREAIQRAIRWPVIRWMDRYPDTCWAELVMWWNIPSLHPWYEIHDLQHMSQSCHDRGEADYCGKCTAVREGRQW